MCKILVLVLFAISFNYATAYRILCPYQTTSRSHFIVVDALFRGLAAKGHNVTVISAYPPEKPIPNYRHITIKHVMDHEKIMKEITIKPGETQITMDALWIGLNVSLVESRGLLENPEFKKIMAEEQFDLMIVEYLFLVNVGLSAHFNNCPVVIFSSFNYYPNILLEYMGSPLALPYVGQMFLDSNSLTGFKGRLTNMMFYAIEKMVIGYFQSNYVKFHNEYFPAPKYPSYQDVLNNNLAAVFIACHFSQGGVRPLVPGVVEIGGIHIPDTPTPLPEPLQEWLDNSTNGVIYFSLGTIFKISYLESDKLDAILNVFRKIKQNILWKSDLDTLPGLPDNVRLEKWAPQFGVLNHQNTKLFISHGGLGSVTEAKHYGVPLLVIPMFGDQIMNAELVVAEGWGTKLSYAELNAERLFTMISELFENPKYRDRAKYESTLFRDRPITPLQNGLFWIEYILRHKGARHMRSNASQLNWFQLHSLDVIGFLLVSVLILVYIMTRILKLVVRKLFGPRTPKVKLKRK